MLPPLPPLPPPLPSFRLICIRTSHTETSFRGRYHKERKSEERQREGERRRGKEGGREAGRSTLPIEPKFDKRKNGCDRPSERILSSQAISPRTISPSPFSLPLRPLHPIRYTQSSMNFMGCSLQQFSQGQREAILTERLSQNSAYHRRSNVTCETLDTL